jgi:hypothetical protein
MTHPNYWYAVRIANTGTPDDSDPIVAVFVDDDEAVEWAKREHPGVWRVEPCHRPGFELVTMGELVRPRLRVWEG